MLLEENIISQQQANDAPWFYGYSFWRGQYTVRNSDYIILRKNYFDKIENLENYCGENHRLISLCIQSAHSGRIDINADKLDEKCVDIIYDIYYIHQKISSTYPYAPLKENSLDIINNICSNSFYYQNYTGKNLYITRSSPVIYAQSNWEKGFPVVKIDCNAGIEEIISYIRSIYELEKKYSQALQGSDAPLLMQPAIPDFRKIKEEAQHRGAMYGQNGDESRAVGLLLFDHITENGGTVADAIRWTKKELQDRGLKNFGKADSSERQFYGWLANTRKCVEAAEVYEISRLDTKRRKLVSDTSSSKYKS